MRRITLSMGHLATFTVALLLSISPVSAQEKALDVTAKRVLTERGTHWIDTKFGGDWDRAYSSYAGTDNTINREELLWFMQEAGVDKQQRTQWADGIFKELNKSKDRTISKREFNSVFRLDMGTSDKF